MNVIYGVKMTTVVSFYKCISVEEGGFNMPVPNEARDNKASNKRDKNEQERQKYVLNSIFIFTR